MTLPMEQALAFNYKPQEYLHTGWARVLPHARLMHRLYAEGQCETEVADYILSAFKLQSDSCFNFRSPRGELVLLSNAELKEALVRVGLLLCARQISLLLMPKDIKRVRQRIGERRYNWLMEQWAQLHENRVMPQAKTDLSHEKLTHLLFLQGLRGVSGYFKSLPNSFRTRLFMKLHPDVVGSLGRIERGYSPRAGALLLKYAIKDIRSDGQAEVVGG